MRQGLFDDVSGLDQERSGLGEGLLREAEQILKRMSNHQVIIGPTFHPRQCRQVDMVDVGTGALEKGTEGRAGLADFGGGGDIGMIDEDDFAALEGNRLPVRQGLAVPHPAIGANEAQRTQGLVGDQTTHDRIFFFRPSTTTAGAPRSVSGGAGAPGRHPGPGGPLGVSYFTGLRFLFLRGVSGRI